MSSTTTVRKTTNASTSVMCVRIGQTYVLIQSDNHITWATFMGPEREVAAKLYQKIAYEEV